jgi:AcrR family transcriptional regulator
MADVPDAAFDRILERSTRSTVDRVKQAHLAEVTTLVEGANSAISRAGSLDPTLKDILAESGLSLAAFYKHFRSKDELMAVVVDDGTARFVKHISDKIASAGSAEGGLRALIDGALNQARNQRNAGATRPFVLSQWRLAERYPELVATTMASVLEQVAAVVAPLVPPARATPERIRHYALCVYHVVYGRLQQHVANQTVPEPDETEDILDFCLAALRA